jgi:hypothetical protein
MTRFFRAWIIVALIFSAKGAFAASNWYVHKGATGANNGTSWTNAWSEMNQINFSAVACGDTIWLAGGTYTTTLAVNKTCTSNIVLNINRVLSTDSVPVAAAGWNTLFDSQVAILNANITIQGAWFTINGRIGTVLSNNFGIQVRCGSSAGCNGIDEPNPTTNVTLTYVESFGPACASPPGGTGTCTNADHGLNALNTTTNLLIDRCWFHQWGVLLYSANWSGVTVQYSQLDSIAITGVEHEDMMFISGPITNLTLRYNKLFFNPNDGIFFFGDETNTQMYGNVYYHSGGALISFYPGFKHQVFIYNNIFENDNSFGDFQPGRIGFDGTVTGSIENNVFENIIYSQTGGTNNAVSDYNAFSASIGKQDNGSHSFTYITGTLGASVLFVSESASDPNAANFRPTSVGAAILQNGVRLSSPYDQDPDGNARGADGHWYIGAYTFGAGTGPQPPNGLVVTVH